MNRYLFNSNDKNPKNFLRKNDDEMEETIDSSLLLFQLTTPEPLQKNKPKKLLISEVNVSSLYLRDAQ